MSVSPGSERRSGACKRGSSIKMGRIVFLSGFESEVMRAMTTISRRIYKAASLHFLGVCLLGFYVGKHHYSLPEVKESWQIQDDHPVFLSTSPA